MEEVQQTPQTTTPNTDSSRPNMSPLAVIVAVVFALGLCAAGGYAIYNYFTQLNPVATFETATSYDECVKLGKSTISIGKPGSCTTESGERFEEFIPQMVDVKSAAGSIESSETTTTQVPNPQLMETKEYSIDVENCVVGTTLTSQLTSSKENETIAIVSKTETECNLVYKNDTSTSQTICPVPRNVAALKFTTMPYGGFHIAPLSIYCN